MKNTRITRYFSLLGFTTVILPLAANISTATTTATTTSQEEDAYYQRMSHGERAMFEGFSEYFNMGQEERLNTLRYKFGDKHQRDNSIFGPSRFFTGFLEDTLKGVSASALMEKVYPLVLERETGLEAQRVLTTQEVIGWLEPSLQKWVGPLADFAYHGPRDLLHY